MSTAKVKKLEQKQPEIKKGMTVWTRRALSDGEFYPKKVHNVEVYMGEVRVHLSRYYPEWDFYAAEDLIVRRNEAIQIAREALQKKAKAIQEKLDALDNLEEPCEDLMGEINAPDCGDAGSLPESARPTGTGGW